MLRSLIAAAALLVACQTEELPEDDLAVSAYQLGADSVTREHVAGDVYHYRFLLPVGTGPNAKIAVHRVVRERRPWIPRPTTGEVMFMHGDFALFDTNFSPLSTWLAERSIDVWGVDRRWTQAPATGADLSDFDAMDLKQMLDDTGVALAFARGVRLVTGSGGGKLTLSGFSRGGELAYFYASREATRPAGLRHVDGIVPIDVYVSLAPEDEELRQFWCTVASDEYASLDLGFVDVPNDFQILTGQLARDAPDEPSPIFPSMTNREWMLLLVGQTYALGFVASPFYHLIGAFVVDDAPTGLRFSTEDAVNEWLANAPPHQSLRESADTDRLTCGDAPLPLDVPLSRIEVPLMLLAAKGGYGNYAIYSTTQVSSTDVTTLVVSQLPDEQEAEDFGHADLLFAADAPALAWEPLRAWINTH